MAETEEFIHFNAQELKNTKEAIYIYGLNEYTKGSVIRLAECGIYVSGFLVEEDIGEIDFINKKVYSVNRIEGKGEQYVAIDIFGKHMDRLRSLPHCIPYQLYLLSSEVSVAIYGAGKNGAKLFKLLKIIPIKVLCFIDKDIRKQGELYYGYPVNSLSQFKKMYPNTTVVVALDSAIANDVANDLRCNHLLRKVYTYKNVDMFPMSTWKAKTGILLSVFHMAQLIQLRIRRNKKIILFGEKTEVISLRDRLLMFDMDTRIGIDINGYLGNIDGMTFCDPYDLKYEDAGQTIVEVLNGYQEKALEFIRQSGINPLLFEYMDASGIVKVMHKAVLDPNLGFNFNYDGNESVLKIVRPKSSSRPIKVGIVGGSTSDVTLYNVKAWPEYLLEYIEDNNIPVELHAGGTGGYVVSQELVKFSRDMAHLGLDILISYSRVNEPIATEDNFYTHPYQKQLFSLLNKGKNTPICYGVKTSDRAEHWLLQERMMHGICQELGIAFYAICQPCFYDKPHISEEERSMEECIKYFRWEYFNWFHFGDYQKCKKILDDIGHIVECKKHDYPWLVDFRHIFSEKDEGIYFDDYHMTEKGNKILAENVYKLIENNLLRIMRERT